MKYLIIAASLVCLSSCGSNENKPAESESKGPEVALSVPEFNADSAYQYVATQVALGPRTPGSAAQGKCAAWMQAKLVAACDTVYRQETKVKGGDGKMLPCINLIGSINPKASRRVLLLTHWDCRPWADQDTKDKDKSILAADDAGSGVGVLLEMARQIKAQKLSASIGIDILLTDVEDYGKTEWGENSYCLGTQYWGTHPHVPGYKAEMGILLDMVGARNAVFPLEALSSQYAAGVQQNVWQAAGKAGYSSFFSYDQGGAITDDHEYVNKLTGIPTIDIINLRAGAPSPFAEHWHTHKDNMDIIDKGTLKAVGQTLLQFIYEMAQPVS